MKKFPKSLTAAQGVASELATNMLLVCFKQPTAINNVTNLVKPLNLVLAPNEKAHDTDRWNIVNHTDTRFWVKTADGKPIEDAQLTAIETALADQTEWIGPVYETYLKNGMESCFCPIPDVVLVSKATKSANVTALAKEHGLTMDADRSKYLSGFYYFKIAAGKKASAFDLKSKMAASGNQVIFENMPMMKPLTATLPNDTWWNDQWDMRQINAPDGWDITPGSNSVVICILDEGCDLSHPDLRFSDVGLNLGTMQPTGEPTGNHGTACAGIAAATQNNYTGVAGVAGGCLILPLAFQNWTDIECAMGINYATATGAAVISMSFGVYDGWGWDYNIIDPEIQYAFDNNVVMVVASGNENDGSVSRYPARHPLVIAVGGSSIDDNRKTPNSPDGENWWGASYGEQIYNGVLTGLSVVAPCVLCPTTDRLGFNGYTSDDYMLNFNGTSSATPHVAGLAGLLKSQNPSLTNVQIRDIIEKTAAKVGSLPYTDQAGFPNGTRNQEMGYGRIDVLAALNYKIGGSGDDGCSAIKKAAKADLMQMANAKFNHIKNAWSNPDFQFFVNETGCQALNAAPAFYLHWGDSQRDILETEDFKVVILSACNPYNNVEFKGITLSDIEVVHADGTPVELLPDQTPAAMMVPSKLVSFNSIAPCSCSSIELVMKTSGAIAGPYKLKFNYCIEEVNLQIVIGDKAEFEMELVMS